MKKFFLITGFLLGLILIVIFTFGKTTITLGNGNTRKAFSESDFIMNYYNSDDLLLINAWATWCAPCIAEMPMLEKIQKAHQNIKLVSISIDEDTLKLKKFLEKNPGLKMRDITLRNLECRDSIYQKIKLTQPFVSNSMITFDSKQIPYVVLIKNKKILYQAYDDFKIEKLEKIIRANQ